MASHTSHNSRRPFFAPLAPALAALLLLTSSLHAAPPEHTSARPPATYRVEPDASGTFAFVAPTGERFLSLGINTINGAAWRPAPGSNYYNGVQNQFKGDAPAWAADVRSILTSHGFNTIGAWSTPEMTVGDGLHRSIVLYVVGHNLDRCLEPLRPNLEGKIRANVRAMMATYPDAHTNLLGVFLDNEMPWWGKTAWERIPTYTQLERALGLDASDPARIAALDFLRERHNSIEAFSKAWSVPAASWSDVNQALLQSSLTKAAIADRDEFTARLAKSFYQTAAKVVREELPGVLILGTRFSGDAPDAVIAECGAVSDVLSFNDYHGEPQANTRLIDRMWILGGKKPLMITEFAWRSNENTSGNKNSRGAGPVVPDQATRASNYESYVSDIMRFKGIIGAHWFEFADQSPQGRFDGEDSNYGIVDIHHRPYTALLAAMKRTHQRLPSIRAAAIDMAESLPPVKGVRFEPGQFPDRPPTVDLLGSTSDPWLSEPIMWHAADASIAWSRKGSSLVLSFTSGTQYGAAIELFAPASRKSTRGNATTPDWVGDLDGYSQLVLDFEAPEGLQLLAILNEAASDKPGAKSYNLGAGDDGEQFASGPILATGQRQTAVIPLADLYHRTTWGNQKGDLRIDTQALRTIGLQLQDITSAAPKGTVTIHAFRLEK